MLKRFVLILLLAVCVFSAGCGTVLKGGAKKNVIVCYEPGRFCGWPANNGIWSWGDEILVGLYQTDYAEKDCSHSTGGKGRSLLARSLDGGETWSIEDPENFAGDGGETKPSHGGIDFLRPDFAMRCGGGSFFYSYDRGHNWKGPFSFGDFGLENSLTARTDYIVNGPRDCHVFMSVREPRIQAAEKDRAFCARTRNGGKSFEFVSWMTGEPKTIRSVMPSTVRISSNHLVSALRRRFDVEVSGGNRSNKCWIDVYESKDNGKSWQFLSKVADTGRSNGNPPCLVRLKDGRLVVTYARRGVCSKYQFRQWLQGLHARISEDNGKTWGKEIILRDDARTWDIGYTRTVQRLDGKLFTAYYYTTEEHYEQHIAGTIWDPDIAK